MTQQPNNDSTTDIPFDSVSAETPQTEDREKMLRRLRRLRKLNQALTDPAVKEMFDSRSDRRKEKRRADRALLVSSPEFIKAKELAVIASKARLSAQRKAVRDKNKLSISNSSKTSTLKLNTGSSTITPSPNSTVQNVAFSSTIASNEVSILTPKQQTSARKKAFKADLENKFSGKFLQVKKILLGIQRQCQMKKKKGYSRKIDNLYNILTMESIYVQGLGNIKANKGMLTRGVDNQTLDGMNMSRISNICSEMKSNSFAFSPFRRVYIAKPGKKALRPLGIPNFKDKLVQSAIKIILETIYEPEFEKINKNFGFRPGKCAQDAILALEANGTACKYALEGDIVGAYDNVNVKILMKILRKRISDKRFLALIEQGCRCGLMDMGSFHDTIIGVPQGGIASPVLFNIYMHEFDKYIVYGLTKIVQDYNISSGRDLHPIDKNWSKANGKIQGIRIRFANLLKRFKGVKDLKANGTTRQIELWESLLLEKRHLNKLRLSFPNIMVHRKTIRFVYYRYADDWILLCNSDESYVKTLKETITVWLKENLKLDLSPDKTRITNFLKNDRAKFLGFSLGSYKTPRLGMNQNGLLIKSAGQNIIVRINGERVLESLALKKFCKKSQKFRPTAISSYSILPIRDIVTKFNHVQVGIANYYLPYIKRVDVFYRIMYIIQYSCYFTIAKKLKISVSKIFKRFGNPPTFDVNVSQKIKGVLTNTSKKFSVLSTAQIKLRVAELVKDRLASGSLTGTSKDPFSALAITNWRTYKNLSCKCLICGSDSDVEWHHVNRIKNIKTIGFSKVMQQLNRKVVPLCHTHHVQVEKGRYDGTKLGDLFDLEYFLA